LTTSVAFSATIVSSYP